MGYEYYVALETEIGVGSDIYPTILLYPNHFDKIAEDLGLTPLNDFFSNSPRDLAKWADSDGERVEQFVSDEEWLELSTESPEKWFSPALAIETINSLLDYLDRTPTFPNSQNYVKALEVTASVLKVAEEQKVRFHFAVVAP